MKKTLIIIAIGVVALAAAGIVAAMNMNKPQIYRGIEGKDPTPVNLPQDAKFAELFFRYNIAMNMDGSYTFRVKDLGEEGYQLEIESPMYEEDEVFKTKISEKEFSAVKDLVGSLDLDQWNGYDKSDREALDGSSFSSSFVFKTDAGEKITVRASGTNAAPEGYYNLEKGLEGLFIPYKKKYDYDRIPKFIKSDNLETLFVTFKQQGKAGYSKYEFEFRKNPWEGGYNINGRYMDYTGEFGPEMKGNSDMKVFLVKDVKDMDLSPINAVLKKYNIAAINGYDTPAEDYNNSEWFQIGAGYYSLSSDDPEKKEYESLDIMGTEKFADYDAFRKEFLKACIEVATKYDK